MQEQQWEICQSLISWSGVLRPADKLLSHKTPEACLLAPRDKRQWAWLRQTTEAQPFHLKGTSQRVAAAEPSIVGTAPVHLHRGIQANGCSKAAHHWSTIAQHLGYHPNDPRGACLLGLCYLQWAPPQSTVQPDCPSCRISYNMQQGIANI